MEKAMEFEVLWKSVNPTTKFLNGVFPQPLNAFRFPRLLLASE